MTTNESPVSTAQANSVGPKIKTILNQIRDLFLDKVERLKDKDDGNYYWKIKDHISGADIDKGEYLLMDVSRIFREAGIKNNDKYYRKMSRMVAYIRLDYVPTSLEVLIKEYEDNERKKDNV